MIIQFDDFRECLFSRKEHHRNMNVIRSHCHEIYTDEINKIVLSPDDDKRIIMTDECTLWLMVIQTYKKIAL